MPTYEYACDKCGHRYEKMQPMAQEPDKDCPECGAGVRRLIGTGAAVIFKGSGFYQTDYKGSKKPADKPDCPSCPSCTTCPASKD
jgi:putative FmdB family regulatory protein